MQTTQSDPKAPQLPEGITDLYLRHAVLRVRRWVRNRRKGNKMRSVPRHIHEKAQVVRHFMEGQQGSAV